MARPSESARSAFLALVPPDPDVTTRPMFGQLVAFLNGNMFMGLFGDRLFFRLSEADRARVLEQGGADFTTKGYVMIPDGWIEQPEHARGWAASALEVARALPPRPRSATR
jgi:TfoX/Sxy family transcriptional regulator of competence genes